MESSRTIFWVFMKLGATSFGGPLAHIAMMDKELVERRAWLNRQDFLDLHALTQLIPGPNSTELAMAIGRKLAGPKGMIAAGLGFIIPAFICSCIMAILYLQAGRLPIGQELFKTIRPIILVIILRALLAFSRHIPRRALLSIGSLALVAQFAGWNELLILALGGMGLVAYHFPWRNLRPAFLFTLTPQVWESGSNQQLFGVFFKIGAVLFGSGYTLLLYLREDLVLRLGWLTEAQLLDAITVGQITPGPLFSTASFIGFLLQGWAGAGAATLGIFGPAFIMIAGSGYLLPRLQKRPEVPVFLQGVNAAALGLMLSVCFGLAKVSVLDLPSLALALGSYLLMEKAKWDPSWLIILGLLLGLLLAFL